MARKEASREGGRNIDGEVFPDCGTLCVTDAPEAWPRVPTHSTDWGAWAFSVDKAQGRAPNGWSWPDVVRALGCPQLTLCPLSVWGPGVSNITPRSVPGSGGRWPQEQELSSFCPTGCPWPSMASWTQQLVPKARLALQGRNYLLSLKGGPAWKPAPCSLPQTVQFTWSNHRNPKHTNSSARMHLTWQCENRRGNSVCPSCIPGPGKMFFREQRWHPCD